MTSSAWARACILWSGSWLVFSAAQTIAAEDPTLAAIHAACALVHAALVLLGLRMLAKSRRLEARAAAFRRSDRARLRALAWLGVWTDRAAVHGHRHPHTFAAHLGAVRAVACYEVAVADLEFLP